MSAVLSLVPPAVRRPRSPYKKAYSQSRRRQYWRSPSWMKPAVDAAFSRGDELVAVHGAGDVPIFVYQPTWRTVASLAGVLGLVHLAVLVGMVLRLAPHELAFGVSNRLAARAFGLLGAAHHGQVPALVFSGATVEPQMIRVTRPGGAR